MYGPLIGADHVRGWVRDHLEAWTPAYIAEAARQRQLDPADVPTFATFDIRADDTLEPWMQLPSLVTLCTNQTTRMRRSGWYSCRFRIAVVVYAGGHDHESTTQLVGLLVAAVTGAMLQHPDLGGHTEQVLFDEVVWDRVAPTERAEVWDGGAAVFFNVDVAGVIDADADTPTEPPEDPLADPPDPPPAPSELGISIDLQEPA